MGKWRRPDEPITDMVTLLDQLDINPFIPSDRDKARVELHLDRAVGNEQYFLVTYTDDGRGHSNAFGRYHTPVSKEVAEEARRLGYVHGKLKPGYASEREFILDEQTKKHLSEILAEEERKVEAAKKKENAPQSTSQ